MGKTTWATVDPATGLRERYRAQGWWDDRTLPLLLQDALSRAGSTTFPVHPLDRPWTGTNWRGVARPTRRKGNRD